MGALGIGGCSPSPCGLEYLGDASAEPTLEVVTIDWEGQGSAIDDGGDVAIVIPPQGGRVVFAGAHVRNFPPCGATLSGVLRDPISKQVRLDFRTINLKPVGDGSGGSVDADISTFSNIPVCSNQWADQDVFDQSFELVVTVESADGEKKIDRTLNVIPRCNPSDVGCECLCKQGYMLGEACGGQP